MPSQYWVQSRGNIFGPYSMDELKWMAAARKILPHDKVSEDQRHWIVASRVPGLMSLKRAGPVEDPAGDAALDDEPRYLASTVDGKDVEYGLRPPEVEAPPPVEPLDAKPPPPALPAGSQHRITVAQHQAAGCLGGILGFLIFFASLPAAAAVSMVFGLDWGEYGGVLMTLVPLAGLLLGVGVFLLIYYGSYQTIDIEVRPGGCASVTLTLTRRFAHIPWSRQHTFASRGDRLEKRIKQDNSGGYEPAFDQLLMGLLLVLSPGRFLFRYFILGPAVERDRRMDRFRLLLNSRESPAPLLLFQDNVEGYFATRYGTPRAAEEIITLLQGAAPELQVHEIEE